MSNRCCIVTPTFKSTHFVEARQSLESQTSVPRHIVVDGGSGSPWVETIQNNIGSDDVLISEPDSGVYSALNKGIGLCSRSIIGVLHSDDRYASDFVIERVEEAFLKTNADVVYGDITYVNDKNRTVRAWRSAPYHRWFLKLGWMPPHPAIFVKKSVFERIGLYDTSYRISGDYEFILRLFMTRGLSIHYLPLTITNMKLGGISNRDLHSLLVKTVEDIRAMRTHGVCPLIALPLKNIGKLIQFALRPR